MKRPALLFAAVLLAGTSLTAPAHAGLFDWGSSKPAEKPADAAKPATPAASLDGDIRQAQLLRASGNYDDAIRALAQMMLVYPDDPRVVGEYGKVLVQQGRSQDAVNFLRRATDLQPGEWTYYSALGVAYDQVNDPVHARAAYERALQLKPGEPAVLNNYALSRTLAGDLDGAQRMLAQAAAAPNADPRIARNVAMVASLKPVTSTNIALARPLPPNTIAQRVPVDPKAGPVVIPKAVAAAKPDAASRAPRALTADAKKPAKKDATPALRMTADASAP
jgi:Flp pilus assembly protein TadD